MVETIQRGLLQEIVRVRARLTDSAEQPERPAPDLKALGQTVSSLSHVLRSLQVAHALLKAPAEPAEPFPAHEPQWDDGVESPEVCRVPPLFLPPESRAPTTASAILVREEKEEQEENVLEQVLTNVEFAVALLNHQFDFVYVNRAFAEAGGRTPDSYVGRNYFDLFPNDGYKPIFEWVVETGESYLSRAKPLDGTSGPNEGARYWDWTLRACKQADGQVSGLVLSLNDVTGRIQAEEHLRTLAGQIVLLQEEERRRLSHELHDEANQTLAAVKLSLELVQNELPAGLESLHRRVAHTTARIGDTIEQIRALAHDLRPPALDTLGLNATLEGLCRDYGRRNRLAIEYAGTEIPGLPDPVRISLYRFLQQALSGARHALAQHVAVSLRREGDGIRLTVEDDGWGLAQRSEMGGTLDKLGPAGQRERFRLLGGELRTNARGASGSCLTAYVPLYETDVPE